MSGGCAEAVPSSAWPDRSRFWKRLNAKGRTPGRRSGAASVMVGTKLYIFGGYGGNGRLDDFFCYDLEQKSWTKIESTGDAPTFHRVSLTQTATPPTCSWRSTCGGAAAGM